MKRILRVFPRKTLKHILFLLIDVIISGLAGIGAAIILQFFYSLSTVAGIASTVILAAAMAMWIVKKF